MADRWARRLEFWKSTPRVSSAIFLSGVFFMFLPVGLLGDIAHLGADPPSRVAANILFSGGIAAVYVLVARRPRWMPVLIVFHVVLQTQFDRFTGARGAPLAGDALQA